MPFVAVTAVSRSHIDWLAIVQRVSGIDYNQIIHANAAKDFK
jgi:hypothetical protein